MPCGQKAKHETEAILNKFNKDFKNGPHQKKNFFLIRTGKPVLTKVLLTDNRQFQWWNSRHWIGGVSGGTVTRRILWFLDERAGGATILREDWNRVQF